MFLEKIKKQEFFVSGSYPDIGHRFISFFF